jgi:hypothetical protein
VITKTDEHDIDRAGKRLLREVLETAPLRWVVNDVQEDYGIDSTVQVFDNKSPSGASFRVQLKSSASSGYSADRSFISQELSIDHARHYAIEMREPVFLVHADVMSKRIFWYAPQLDRGLIEVLGRTGAKGVTLRVPTAQDLPSTAPALLQSLDTVYLVLASRTVTSASNRSFAESIKHLPDQEALHEAFQEKSDALKLQKIADLFREKQLDAARLRTDVLLSDPDSTIETKFWARVQLEGIEYSQNVHAGKPQSELPKISLTHAKALQELTSSGPRYLKFYALIARKAAELGILVHTNYGLFLALRQNLEVSGNPMKALSLYAQRSAITKQIVSKYNQCVRLARYATNYPDRWMLGRALVKIVHEIGEYLVTLSSEDNSEGEKAFAQSSLQICKVAAWICRETGDAEGVVLCILSAMMTTRSTESEAYRWAMDVAQRLSNLKIRADALHAIDRAVKRWRGEPVEGDYVGDTMWQIIQNMAPAVGIDLANETVAFVQALKIAAKDNNPERVLSCCEHIIESQGATGPIARRIQSRFNTAMASSKVVHCTLHGFHVEGRELDTAHAEFKQKHCDVCPDRKPRPESWRYTEAEKSKLQARHLAFVMRLAGTPFGLRYTNED